jgi:uncharacterized membrane protein YfcA
VLLLAYLLALIIGLTLGMIGGGGSILTVPVFVYVLHYDPKLAIAMSLPVVGATSLVGAIGHWRAGDVRLATAVVFGVFTMTGAYVAAGLSTRIAGRTQLFVLGAVMLVAAALMLRDSLKVAAVGPGSLSSRASRLTLAVVGLSVGALTGVVGIGGGFLIVPALVVLAHVPMRQAVGTSLLVITMNSLAGFAGRQQVGEIPVRFVITFAAVAAVGIIAGTQLSRYVEQRTLKRAFAVFLLVIAALVLWQSNVFQLLSLRREPTIVLQALL